MATQLAKAVPKPLLGVWLVALIAAPLVLWWLPADHFDSGQSLCPSVLFFSIECFGCGMTRSIMHFHHFEFHESIFFHNLGPLVYVIGVYFWILWTYRTATRLGLFGETRALALEEKLFAKKSAEIQRRRKN